MNKQLFREIKSYILRPGRITEGQKKAIETLMPLYGIKKSEKRINLQKYFNKQSPIFINIGFGDGKELIDLSTRNPNKNFLGIEVHSPGIGKLLLSIKKLKIENIRIINGDAIEVIRDMIEDETIAGINLFFPDPWPKKRHHKRRIITHNFIKLVSRVLKKDGNLHISTDWANYAQHIQELMLQYDNFLKINQPSHRPETKFEKRGEKLGYKIQDIEYKKNEI